MTNYKTEQLAQEEKFDEKFPELWGSNDGREGYDSFVKEDVKKLLLSRDLALLEAFKKDVGEMIEKLETFSSNGEPIENGMFILKIEVVNKLTVLLKDYNLNPQEEK